MIEVDLPGKSPFPTVDFKFVNRGLVSAVLWQIGIVVESVKINKTPVLSFSRKVRHGIIEIATHNAGWGPAELRMVEIRHFMQWARQVVSPLGIIPGGGEYILGRLHVDIDSSKKAKIFDRLIRERQDLLVILPKAMLNEDFDILTDERFRIVLSNHERWHVEEFFEDLRRGDAPSRPRQKWHIEYSAELSKDRIPVNEIVLDCSVRDVDGKEIVLNEKLLDSGLRGQTWGTRDGFEFEPFPPPAYCVMPPTMRMAILDVNEGATERKYPVSTKTPAGDAERFQITVGSEVSCLIKASFKFYFDNDQIVRSKPFELAVWCPRGSGISAEDGAQFVPTNSGWRLANGDGKIEEKGW